MTRRRGGRRSQRRLGTQLNTSAPRIRFSLQPLDSRWQARASRILAAVVMALLGSAIYLIFDSNSFYVFDVEVEGNTVVTREEVYAAAGMDGLSVFWVDPIDIGRRVETLPNVRQAQVSTALPAQVIVKVEERTPEFIWQTGEERWWVDGEGTIVPLRAHVEGALTIVDDDIQPVSPGHMLDTSIIQAAYSLRRLLPELSTMHYSRATGISFKTREGWPVFLGDGSNMDAKLTTLVALRNHLLARGAAPEFIDVRFVDKPFYR